MSKANLYAVVLLLIFVDGVFAQGDQLSPQIRSAFEKIERTMERKEGAAPAAAPPPAAPVPAPAPVAAERKGWLDRLKAGLRKTGSSIATVFTGTQIDDALYEELEEALLMADTGVKATAHLLADLKRRVKEAKATDPAAVKGLLADAIADLLAPLQKPLVIGEHKPTVIMVAGVNGAGKTTSIGKLTRHLAQGGASVLLAAADTFRAAAVEQLQTWGARIGVEVIAGKDGAEPASVVFDAAARAGEKRVDFLLVDTAGRLHNKNDLMAELGKVKRVIEKSLPVSEVLLVIDATTGQNGITQAKIFTEAVNVTGLILTKLDGSARGGVALAIESALDIPIKFIGTGEGQGDFAAFEPDSYIDGLLA